MPSSDKTIRCVQAHPQTADGGHQITYEKGGSRRVHRFPQQKDSREPRPHGAGSYYDPEHHRVLLDRVEAMQRGQYGH